MAIQPVAPQIPTTLPGSLTEEAIAVRGALLDRGLETPMTTNDLSRDQQYDVIRGAFGDIMKALGLDLRDDSLEETPHRICKMFVDEVFSGLTHSIRAVDFIQSRVDKAPPKAGVVQLAVSTESLGGF